MIRHWQVVLPALAIGCSPTGQGTSTGSAASYVAAGDRHLEAGRYEDARRAYTTAAQAAGGNKSLQASALFGKALASQQSAATGSDSLGSGDSVLVDYRAARILDSSRLFGPASNNAGLVLRARGRHQEALRYFLDAAGTKHRAQAYFYLNAGREYERLGKADSATAIYRKALETDPGYAEARQALLRLYVRRPTPDSLLAAARKWSPDPGSSASVNDAILAFLLKPEAPAGRAYADSLLLTLAGNFASAGLSAPRFSSVYAERLAEVQRRYQALAEPITALRDAYKERSPGELYAERAGADWWHRTDGHGGPRAVWSRCLRTLGDGHDQAGNKDVAASYYEAAVGYPGTEFLERWVDLDALLPLGVIYVARASDHSTDQRAVQRLNQLIDRLFEGKMAAYEAGDLPRIRSFHITLGKMYADRGQWGDMYNARSAVFQLERMQMMTRRMRQEGHPEAFDPPQLLLTLANGYFTTRRVAEGRRTALAAAATYGRLGLPGDSTKAAYLAASGHVAPEMDARDLGDSTAAGDTTDKSR